MKPGFALDLAHDGIRLLVRRTEGWAELGQVSFDAADLDRKLAMLRGLAETRAPGRVATKLILPASQILYADVDAPGPDRTRRRAQIETALEGLTPYAVKDLVFDWSRIGPSVHVAVVARMTLQEAEEFAEAHGFNPVSFVAIPEAGQFAGEPFFGQATGAETHIPDGDRLDRDQDPVRIVDLTDDTDWDALEPEPEPEPASDAAAVADPVANPVAPDTPSEPPQPADTTASTPAAQATAAPSVPNITAALPPEDPQDEDDDPQGAGDGVGLAVRPAALAATLSPDPGAGGLDAPFIALGDLDDLEPAGDADAALSFASRRSGETDADAAEGAAQPASSRLTLALGEDPSLSDTPELPVAPTSEIAPADYGITAPVLPVPRQVSDDQAGPAGAAAQSAGPSAASFSETRHGTQAQQQARQGLGAAIPAAAPPGRNVFGATLQSASQSMLRPGAGRMLAAILALLVLALTLWWVWDLTRPESTAAATGSAAPEITDRDQRVGLSPSEGGKADSASVPAAPLPDSPPGQASPAALAPSDGATADTALAEQANPAGPPTGDAAETATETVAAPPEIAPPANGTIWIAAPLASKEPTADAPGAPFIASAAPGPGAPAALSPLAQAGTAPDAMPLWQPLPPPFGTVFEFLPDGAIRPSEEGVVTPDGYTLVAGPPPVIPAPRPGSAAAEDRATATGNQIDSVLEEALATPDSAPDNGAVPVISADNPAHGALKPRARPAEVVARAAAARAAAEAAAAAEAEAAAARAEALASATPLAVASSRRPAARPSGLSRVVEDAIANAVAETVTASTPAKAADVDEPEPVAPTPNIPTSVTVAKQATIKNALNLGEISLIGVFGSSSSRRALVRMPSGRMMKVKIGDRLNGGKVAAIGDSELSYVKHGRTHVLKMIKKG